jgi:hypothetical protein
MPGVFCVTGLLYKGNPRVQRDNPGASGQDKHQEHRQIW